MSFKRVIITKYGPPEVLKLIEEEKLPEPRNGEVRVKVLTASASFTDTLLRKGIYPEVRVKPPLSPGYDLVGIVDKIGHDVSSVKTGEKVAAMTVYGAYAEYLCVPEEKLVPVPDEMDPSEVVSLILTYITAYQMLHRSAKIQQDMTILVHGAGGAVGTALVQLARLMNVKVYGTARKQKHDLIKQLGAIPIDYELEDFVKYIKAKEIGGIDAVFDGIGGDYFKRSFTILKPGGILTAYGFQKIVIGSQKILDFLAGFIQLKILNLFSLKRKSLFYSITTMQKKHPDWFKEDFTKLLKLLQEGRIKPVIAAKMSLSEAVEAHKRLDQSKVEGKIIFIVGK